MIRIGFICFRIGTSGWLFWKRLWTLGFYKRWNISLLAESTIGFWMRTLLNGDKGIKGKYGLKVWRCVLWLRIGPRKVTNFLKKVLNLGISLSVTFTSMEIKPTNEATAVRSAFFTIIPMPCVTAEWTNLSSAGVKRSFHKSASVGGVLGDKHVSGSIHISDKTQTHSMTPTMSISDPATAMPADLPPFSIAIFDLSYAISIFCAILQEVVLLKCQ